MTVAQIIAPFLCTYKKGVAGQRKGDCRPVLELGEVVQHVSPVHKRVVPRKYMALFICGILKLDHLPTLINFKAFSGYSSIEDF